VPLVADEEGSAEAPEGVGIKPRSNRKPAKSRLRQHRNRSHRRLASWLFSDKFSTPSGVPQGRLPAADVATEPEPIGNHGAVASVEDQIETLDLVNTELVGRLVRQGASGSQIDTKAALLAAVAATGAQFLATREHLDILLATLAYAAYAGAFLAAVFAYALTRYQDVPDPRGLVRECAHRTRAETLAYLVATRVRVFERNVKRHRRKVLLWWVSVIALGFGLALSAAAIVQTDHHDGRSPGRAAGPSTGAGPHADGGRLH
jgi:hypothetical protein